MAPRRPLIISLVERGWQAAREHSLEVKHHEVMVIHLIKGRLSRDIRGLIAPYPGIRLISLPRAIFWPAAWSLIAWAPVVGRLQAVLVDNERSDRRVHRWLHPHTKIFGVGVNAGSAKLVRVQPGMGAACALR